MKAEESVFHAPGFGAPSSDGQSERHSSATTKWPKVVLYSAFRNCRDQVKPFFEKRARLTYPKDRLQHFCLEGDSEDGTYEALREEARHHPNVLLKKADFNGPHIKAFVHPGRARMLARSSAFAMRTLVEETDADYVLLIESDLDYPPDIVERLLRCEKDFVAPMILIKGTNQFYDTYAFRKGVDPDLRGPTGEPGCFQAKPPYHPAYREDALFEVDAAGSCLFFKMDVLRKGAYFPAEDLIVGFCRTARERGYRIWVDPKTVIFHPVPEHVLDWKEWSPWHEVKVFMKYQENVPIDSAALDLGKAYGFTKPLEFAWIAKRLKRDRGAKTLACDSEISTFPAYCAALGLDVTSTDSGDYEDLHRQVMEHSGVRYRFVKGEPTKLPFEDGSFDQVIAACSISRCQDDERAAKEIARICKPNGKIFLTLPYDHIAYWWDHCNGQAPARHYYDMQSVLDRIVTPMHAVIRDITFVRCDIPSKEKDPIFTHPNNAGLIALELEKKP